MNRCALARPTAVQRIRLRSATPTTQPMIDALLTRSAEIDRLRVACGRAVRVARENLRPAGLQRALRGVREVFPPARRLNTDDEIDAYIAVNLPYRHALRRQLARWGHATRLAVVDDLLRVHGAQGLRVVDAS